MTKSIGEAFGFGTLITVFLPGLTLALGMIWVLQTDPGWIARQGKLVDLFAEMKEWQQTFAALALISLLGSLVAAINGFLESCLYDRFTRTQMRLSSEDFSAHWYEYLYRLSKESNSYVSRVVTWFLFESRMAVAVIGVLLFYIIEASDRELLTVVVLIVSAMVLAALGYHHHRELAEYRRFWFIQWQLLRETELAEGERE